MNTTSGEQVLLVNPEKARLAAARRVGASWFNTIGFFAVVNLLLVIGHVPVRFIFALGITALVTGATQLGMLGTTSMALPLVFTLLGFLGARFFAKMAAQGHSWAFITGMVLYALDGLVFVLIKDWVEIAAHGFALYSLYQGLRANMELFKRFPEDPQGTGVTTIDTTPVAG